MGLGLDYSKPKKHRFSEESRVVAVVDSCSAVASSSSVVSASAANPWPWASLSTAAAAASDGEGNHREGRPSLAFVGLCFPY